MDPNKNPTTILDIYVASGATLSEDGNSVTMVTGQLKPFDIVLTVIPEEMSFNSDTGESIKFSVLLDDDYALEPGPEGTRMRHIRYNNASVELPVKQVRIRKDGE